MAIFKNKKKNYLHYPQKEPESRINSEFLALFLIGMNKRKVIQSPRLF
nr:MAG TPA: hypothetical protein [Caudoviricetes sp.]